MFWKVEARSGLYIFFKTVCDSYGLIPEDNYTIPPEAEGIEPAPESRSIPPLILKREPSEPGLGDTDNSTIIDGLSDHGLSTAGTTKRHRHSPSVGATAVSTVVEEAEEEEEHPQLLVRPVTQIFETTPEDDETAEEESASGVEAVEESAPAAPESAPAGDEAEKQSASEEAKADPPLGDGDKQSGAEAAIPSNQDDEATSDPEVPEDKALDLEDPEESSSALDATAKPPTLETPETKSTPAATTTESAEGKDTKEQS